MLYLSLGVQQFYFFGGFYIQKTASTELCPNTVKKRGHRQLGEKKEVTSPLRHGCGGRKLKYTLNITFMIDKRRYHIPGKHAITIKFMSIRGVKSWDTKTQLLFPAWTRTDTFKTLHLHPSANVNGERWPRLSTATPKNRGESGRESTARELTHHNGTVNKASVSLPSFSRVPVNHPVKIAANSSSLSTASSHLSSLLCL